MIESEGLMRWADHDDKAPRPVIPGIHTGGVYSVLQNYLEEADRNYGRDSSQQTALWITPRRKRG